MAADILDLRMNLPVRASNGGLFMSRGLGRHPDRVIDSYEIIVVASGCLGICEDGIEYHLQAGDALVLYPGLRHRGLAQYPPDLSFYWLHFHLAASRTDPAGFVLPIPKLSHASDPEALAERCRIFLSQQEQGHTSQFRLDLSLLQILDELATAGSHQPKAGIAPFARQADLFITTHFHQKISTRDIARYVGCNEDYLGRIYRQAFGLTMTEAITRCRIRLACRRLLEGTVHMDQITREVGFEDPGYFRRVFRKAKGMSPTQYRSCFSQMHVNAV